MKKINNVVMQLKIKIQKLRALLQTKTIFIKFSHTYIYFKFSHTHTHIMRKHFITSLRLNVV